jgi:hypothetical protein
MVDILSIGASLPNVFTAMKFLSDVEHFALPPSRIPHLPTKVNQIDRDIVGPLRPSSNNQVFVKSSACEACLGIAPRYQSPDSLMNDRYLLIVQLSTSPKDTPASCFAHDAWIFSNASQLTECLDRQEG